ncbi:hypothetical protein GCM10010145_43230 [Streptomyces ruber]|uniref:Uncharacterized protein n=2 Tax=Streptomyces TaxID=1883 RepID=A0A918EU69_9ACTN|nr:hypothetical protein GCM10010145_43230 [Streptomyces ruber]
MSPSSALLAAPAATAPPSRATSTAPNGHLAARAHATASGMARTTAALDSRVHGPLHSRPSGCLWEPALSVTAGPVTAPAATDRSHRREEEIASIPLLCHGVTPRPPKVTAGPVIGRGGRRGSSG